MLKTRARWIKNRVRWNGPEERGKWKSGPDWRLRDCLGVPRSCCICDCNMPVEAECLFVCVFVFWVCGSRLKIGSEGVSAGLGVLQLLHSQVPQQLKSKPRVCVCSVHGRLGQFAQRPKAGRTWRASPQASEIRLYQPFGCVQFVEGRKACS